MGANSAPTTIITFSTCAVLMFAMVGLKPKYVGLKSATRVVVTVPPVASDLKIATLSRVNSIK